ncbi:MAG: glycosyltransferase family 9 protein [Ignavibacteriaceae bacterium]|nr:glycosyltransferase family 9 protein [Ignavibacteriaceae bacterium]
MIEPKNLLIVRTDRIGDVILSLPLAEIIKKHFPKCKITYLLRDYTECLANNHPFIDQIIILKEKSGKALINSNCHELRKHKFDSSIIVYPTFLTALITFLSGIKNRIGTGYRWYSFLFNYKIFEHRKYAEKHELEYNVNLLKAFGINEELNTNSIHFNLNVPADGEFKVEKLLNENRVDTRLPIIIIHPGSGGSAIDLPIASFLELVKIISEKLKAAIIITGSQSEKKLCDQLTINNSVKNFAGMLRLSDLIALINKSSLFISNSTGPIHIAAALGKSTIGFYPKILSCSAKRWGPYSNKTRIFIPTIDCKNCTRKQCEKLNCMNSINMKDVFYEVQNLINFNKNVGEINV